MRKQFFSWLDKHSSPNIHTYPILKRGDYGSHPDIEMLGFGNSESVTYQEPQHFGDLLPEYVNTIGKQEYPAPFILDIKQGKLWGRHALTTTADNQIIAESIFNHLSYLNDISTGRIHYPKSIEGFLKQLTSTAHYETVFVLANYFGNAFYHWMMESLPRLYLLKQYQHTTGQTIPILVNSPLPKFAQETLALFGIEDILFWDATYGEANHLLMPMAINGTGIPSPTIMKHVSQQLISEIGDLPKLDSPRIYISRKNSPKRRVINEDSVLPLLEKHGFQSFTLEELTLTEQIALFQQAEVVIGAHGAGFTNCIHSQNIKMLEFFEPSYINLCFYRLACGYGFGYGYLVGESQGLNIIFDTDDLEVMLQKMAII